MIFHCNEIVPVFVSTIEFTSFGRFIQALLVLVYAVSRDVVQWKLEKALVILGGVFLFMGYGSLELEIISLQGLNES